MSIAVFLAFYSPAGYALPKAHLARTLEWLATTGLDITVAQVVRPGESPQPVPSSMRAVAYETEHALFYKENLWNITAGQSDADKLFFMDTDVAFSTPDVFARAAELLETCDIAQPFEMAAWPDRCGAIFQARRAAAFAISRGVEPTPARFHPGFAWCMTRETFSRLGGFYERHPFGGGDVALSYAIDRQWVGSRVPLYIPVDAQYWQSPSYRAYQANGTSLGLRVGYLPGVCCTHRWHGEIADRQYTTRGSYFEISPGQEYPMSRREDGLLEWHSAEQSEMVRAYFQSRREDG